MAAGPDRRRSSVISTPLRIRTSPVISSKAKPSEKTSVKSSVIRRGSDCSDSTPRSFPMPGSILVKRPGPTSIRKAPDSVG